MSDIADRLRDVHPATHHGTLARDAADEIERLRAANAELLAALKDVTGKDGYGEPWYDFGPTMRRRLDALIARHEGSGDE